MNGRGSYQMSQGAANTFGGSSSSASTADQPASSSESRNDSKLASDHPRMSEAELMEWISRYLKGEKVEYYPGDRLESLCKQFPIPNWSNVGGRYYSTRMVFEWCKQKLDTSEAGFLNWEHVRADVGGTVCAKVEEIIDLWRAELTTRDTSKGRRGRHRDRLANGSGGGGDSRGSGGAGRLPDHPPEQSS